MTPINVSTSLPITRRLSFPILAFLAALAVGLLLFLPGGPARAQEAGPILYAENGTEPVRVFTSTDPEGTNPTRDIDWDVTGIDADDFTIRDDNGNGWLTFRESPDFETPTDRAGEAIDPTDNLYQVTVRATEQSGYTGRALSTERDITVEVTNVNEDGAVEIEWRQPQVDVEIRAFLTDPDGDLTDVAWTWTVSKVANPDPNTETHWEAFNGAVGSPETDGARAISTYTPAAGTSPDTTDVDKMLRATVTYTAGEMMETVRAVSEFPVRAVPTTTHNPSLDVSPSVINNLPENTPVGMGVGGRVSATDDDDDDIGKFTSTLMAAADAADADDVITSTSTRQREGLPWPSHWTSTRSPETMVPSTPSGSASLILAGMSMSYP